MKPNTASLDLNNYFNSISNAYSVNEYASLYTTRLMRKLALNCITDFKDKSVLDLMSGTGENIRLLKNTKDIKSISTLDYSSKMNSIAKEKLKYLDFEQIEGDFFKTNHLKTYDVILCSFGVKTFTEKSITEFCNKVNGLLNPNGEIVLLELVKPKSQLLTSFLKFYLNNIVATFYGKKFKQLFPFIEANKNLNTFKNQFTSNRLSDLRHQRKFLIYEVIHAKKALG